MRASLHAEIGAEDGAERACPAPAGECELCGAEFDLRQSGGAPQRFCGRRCRDRATAERRKAEPDPEPEPLAILLNVPMPAVPAVEEPPPARVRVKKDRECFVNSAISNAEPIHDDHRMREARRNDRIGDERFVAALAPALTPAARERAQAVRVQDGDLAAGLLG